MKRDFFIVIYSMPMGTNALVKVALITSSLYDAVTLCMNSEIYGYSLEYPGAKVEVHIIEPPEKIIQYTEKTRVYSRRHSHSSDFEETWDHVHKKWFFLKEKAAKENSQAYGEFVQAQLFEDLEDI